MIKAISLRLGNRLWWNPASATAKSTLPPTLVEVASIEADHIGYFSPRVEHRAEPFEDDLLQTQTPHRPIEEFEPIPLTKELVESCVFNEKSDGWQSISMKQQPAGYEVWLAKERLGRVDYLHELQNLYFTLTGEELEIGQ